MILAQEIMKLKERVAELENAKQVKEWKTLGMGVSYRKVRYRCRVVNRILGKIKF
ncbi:MAG: hypothetical protein HFJ52_05805 [Clostridia bacterium]|nr:hypothetical protein [Clostridia bacterium]